MSNTISGYMHHLPERTKTNTKANPNINRPVGTAEPPRRFRGSHSNRRQPVPPEKLPKIAKNNLKMTITRPTPGLRSSSFAHPIQVDHPGAHGTGPDRFRAIQDDFLMKMLFCFSKCFFPQKMFFSKKTTFSKK